MKKILVITFNYPPYNVTGSYRIMRITKYFAKNGIEPFVLTSKQKNPIIDDNLLKNIPQNTKIFREKCFFDDYQARIKKENFLKPYKNKNHTIRDYLKDFFFSPDIHIYWALKIIPKAVRIIKENKIEHVFFTLSPFSLGVTSYLLKKLTKVKITVDFRDPWSQYSYQQQQTFIRRMWNVILEKKCLNSADLIISVTPEILSFFKKQNKNINTMLIRNGYDKDDYIDVEDWNGVDKASFNLFYAGKFTYNDNGYNPKKVLDAIKKFNSKSKKKINLIIAGIVDESAFKDYSFIQYLGFFPRKKIIEIGKKMDCFLHFHYPWKMKNTLSIKMFEYVAMRKPIVSFSSLDSEVGRFLNQSNCGFVCENDNIDGFVDILKKVIEMDKDKFESEINYEYIKQFDMENITKNLIERMEIL